MDSTIDTTRFSSVSAAPSRRVVDDVRFVALFQTEYEPMLRLAFVMLRSQTQAQDVVHDSMAKLIERWDRVDNPGGYLRTTVVNRCRGRIRALDPGDQRRPTLDRLVPLDIEPATLDDAAQDRGVRRLGPHRCSVDDVADTAVPDQRTQQLSDLGPAHRFCHDLPPVARASCNPFPE